MKNCFLCTLLKISVALVVFVFPCQKNNVLSAAGNASNNSSSMDPFSSILSEISSLSKSQGGNGDVSTLIKQADGAIHLLQQEAERKEAVLEESAKKGVEKIRIKLEEEIKKMKHDAQAMAMQLKDEIKKESMKIELDAVQRALNIVNRAEEEAFLRRNKERHDALEKRFSKYGLSVRPSVAHTTRESRDTDTLYTGKAPQMGASPLLTEEMLRERVTPEWKNDIARQFYSGMSFMKKIILDGESPQEAQDFAKRFSDQNLWFDKTLRSTEYVNDPFYNKIVTKQTSLDKIVSAQKKADDFLRRFSKNADLSPDQMQKVRLMLLYDLNSVVNKQMTHMDPIKRLATLSDDEIKGMAKKVLEEFSLQFKQRTGLFTDVKIIDQKTTEVVPVMAKRLQEELDETQSELDATKMTLAQEVLDKQRIKEFATTKINELSITQISTEVDLKTVENKLEKTEEQASIALRKIQEADSTKQKLVKKLEDAGKGNVELQIALRQANQGIDQVKQQAAVEQVEIKEEMKSKFVLLIEEKEKRSLELKTLLEYAVEKANLFEEKAQKLEQEKISLLKNAQHAQKQAQDQSHLRMEADLHAKTVEDLATKTIRSINRHMSNEKALIEERQLFLNEKEAQLVRRGIEVGVERDALKKDQQELLYLKNVLRQEEALLEGLKEETRKIVKNSAKIHSENTEELLQLQQQAELELQKIAKSARKELDYAHKQLTSLKHGING